MPYLDKKLQEQLDRKLALLNKARPLSAKTVAKLREQLGLEMTYNSNAIEGNRLSLKETFLVISQGITIKGKSLKDHLEAKDHYEALNYLYELVEQGKRHTFSEVFIRSLQQLVVRETDPKTAGTYRQGLVRITGSTHIPPEAHEVPRLMRDLIEWTRDNQSKVHPIELAATVHHKIVHIHPFEDGNGRTARLVMNLLLMREGYPLGVILKNDRKRYYDTLEAADRGDYAPFVRFIAQAVERSINIYLQIIGPSKGTGEEFLPLAALSKLTMYSKKYLNLLAHTGKIEAHKEGRNWLASLAAVERYRAGRERKRK